jgi:guanine deaminase
MAAGIGINTRTVSRARDAGYNTPVKNRTGAYRATIIDFIDDPLLRGDAAYRHFSDGLLWVEDGRVVDCGDFAVLNRRLPDGLPVHDLRPCLIMPGFIDTHVHSAQTDVIATYAGQLLSWLERCTYPEEERFSDPLYARESAEFFVSQLLRNGTTSAAVFTTTFASSVDAVFEAASRQGMRLISGKLLMDRHAPQRLLDEAQNDYDDCVRLIRQWHGKDRLQYAVSPRFAPTSSERQLKVAQQLFHEFDGVYLQSHLAENPAEVAWVTELFPHCDGYVDVYDHYGLLAERAIYAHGIHLDTRELSRLSESGAALAFCPSSNLFLGSGLLDLSAVTGLGMRMGLATDVGAGTSFCLLQTMRDAFRVRQLRGFRAAPCYYFYLATLGAARALYVDSRVGNVLPGREADFIVIDVHATELMWRRMMRAETVDDLLFMLMILGDERSVRSTYILGEKRFDRGDDATRG